MKKIIILAAAFSLSVAAFSQAPQKMSYQAVLRNSSNSLLTNTSVGMRVSVLQGSPNGPSVFTEIHTPQTNANGLVSLEIGGGTAQSGSLPAIDWSQGPYFLKTETDPSGGTSYSLTGTSQFLSVPYALYAETSGTPGPQGPAGATGAQGATGPQGPAGNDGAQGPQGATGAAGLSAYGVWLNAGNTGTEADFLASLTGAQGPIGNTGATGPQGPAGATGVQGPQGNAGLSAYQIWLNAGNTGTEADFIASLKGATGAQGPIGNTGATGPQGPAGATGAQGPAGSTGPQGIQGNTGSSAYRVWLDAGNTGTEADFIASLKGATGATGATGPQGPMGSPNVVQSYCLLADAGTHSVVTIGGVSFRVNSGGFLEAMCPTGLYVQAYSLYYEASFYPNSNTAIKSFMNQEYYNSSWNPLIRYAVPPSGTSQVPLTWVGNYCTQDVEIFQMNTPASMPLKSFRVHAARDGWGQVFLRVEYFQ